MATRPGQTRLTAEAFMEWAAAQPRGRYELSGGEIVAMAPERLAHTRLKYEMMIALRTAIADRGLGCEAIGDGISVRIDDHTLYEPDALVRCGPQASGEALDLDDPVIVVEVVSPSGRGVDTGVKFTDYFRLPSVRHYLIVQIEARAVIHHRRDGGGTIETRIVHDGTLALDPPGLGIAVPALFALL